MNDTDTQALAQAKQLILMQRDLLKELNLHWGPEYSALQYWIEKYTVHEENST